MTAVAKAVRLSAEATAEEKYLEPVHPPTVRMAFTFCKNVRKWNNRLSKEQTLACAVVTNSGKSAMSESCKVITLASGDVSLSYTANDASA